MAVQTPPLSLLRHLPGRPSRATSIVLLVALLGIGVGTGAAVGTQVAAGRRDVPPVTAEPVTTEVVATTLQPHLRARVQPPDANGIPVALAASAVAVGGPSAVTSLPRPGDVLDLGDELARVDDRPVRLLAGEVPMYRDLVVGSSGPDVRQLQAGLRGLGLRDMEPDGVLDADTAAQVAALLGAPVGDGRDDARAEIVARLDAARAAVGPAQRAWDVETGRLAAELDLAVADAAARAAAASREVAALRAERDCACGDPPRSAEELDELMVVAEATRAAASAAGGEAAQQRADLGAVRAAGRPTEATMVAPVASELAAHDAAGGATVVVRTHDVVFVPTLPVTVAEVVATLGTPPGPLAVLAGSTPTVSLAVTAAEAGLVRVGQDVRVTSDGRPEVGGEVVEVLPPEDGAPTVVVRVRTDVALDPEVVHVATVLLGPAVRADRAVPVEAVVRGPDGDSVTVVDGDGARRRVPVQVGAGDGRLVSVSGRLDVGDRVLLWDAVVGDAP